MNDLIYQANGAGPLTYAEACEQFEVGRVVRRFGTWVVTDWGVTSLQTRYDVPREILAGTNWPAHMADKRWVVREDFNAAYHYALGFFAEREAAA